MAKTICLIGNDGSGKSTQAKIIKHYFTNRNISSKYLHFEHFIFKIPKFVSQKSGKLFSAKDKTDQSIGLIKYFSKFKLFSYILPFMIYLDFLAFYLKEIYFSNKIIILDRYIYDKIVKYVDLGMYSPQLVKPIIKLIPRPKYLFYLKVSPNVSLRRKGELSKEILVLRGKILDRIATDLKAITINADDSMSNISKQIIKYLKNYA